MAATLAKHQANRWPALLEAAAALFAERGYHATTIRDVAEAAGVTPGALYFHVPTKQALLVAVYTEGVDRIVRHVDTLVDKETEPALRFRRAIEAHLESILDASAFARVIVRVLPDDVAEAAAELRAQRDRYETRFRSLIAALGLPSGRSPALLRMLLLGALNATPIWYRRPRGGLDAIVDEFVAVFGIAPSGTDTKPRRRSKR
ncbi:MULTISPECIES: TetR/AcrR family transcriptional regulator [unclassified Bradyrhizobium]|uniref:TetR/AcrR family transcriptional regulator n=1 Tax=unclassified Bradyrhizobium TaxID=2631580 RepID=UPI001BACA258|nr:MULTISPECIES: TetR/AcrR family transcriptional regulator [unclassified Bradyrhizobium]MBR1203000.1 helix-turn-helix transcriptional regulator [Bradyrhizobium sp. AUGA SZCCT0124]MBR1314415.1 helix-turn-helix transcriptional regulator [Bradyrhizobium sp. AUGA SZCCT0051]MBR1342567.1 helix-turn-helix transcriptional regulator [Bradyrhizobium sp. AUGA SZCCT0105]MBR1352797.1 helix-turn-helix transcriptional regulator [Bradyrhizobium sp. AUGA SZCCT0045]